jgi:hypothetical protein
MVEKRLLDIKRGLANRINNIDDVAEVPFNRMEHWGSDGRIKSTSPVHSPFMRHKQKLQIE